MQPPSDHLLRTMAAVPVNRYVLDLGCGTGRHTQPLLRLGFPVHGCDPSPDAVDVTRRRLRETIDADEAENCVRVKTLDTLDYPDASFDWVVAYHVEAYARTDEDLHRLLAETRRMLKPGGWAYVTVPAAPEAVDDEARAAGDGATRPGPEISTATPGSAARATPDGESTPDGLACTIDDLERHQRRANLATASAPKVIEDTGSARLRAIFRRVEPNPSR